MSYLPSRGASTPTVVSIDSTDSPYTVASWGTVVMVDNDAAVTVTLPEATAWDVGKAVALVCQSSAAANNVTVLAPDTDTTFNNVPASGAEVAKAKYKNAPAGAGRTRGVFTAVAIDTVSVDIADDVYNVIRYATKWTEGSEFTGGSYLQLSTVPTDFLTSNADWWFGVKLGSALHNDSSGRVMFGSNNAFVGVQGNGQYWITNGTSGYLQTMSPNTIPDSDGWLLYQYDESADAYTAWVNGTKVLDATTSGATMPSTPPTDMWFGTEGVEANELSDLTLSGMVDTNFNQTYSPLTNVRGRWWSFDNEIDETGYPYYNIYSYDAGGGTWYVIVSDKGGSWKAFTTTVDPTTWVDGTVVALADEEAITGVSTGFGLYYVPWNGDANVTYVVPATPSGYGYPLYGDDRVGVMCLGTGLLTDADAALFTSSMHDPDGLTLAGGTVTNQWTPAASDAITTDVGAINLTLVGSGIETEVL